MYVLLTSIRQSAVSLVSPLRVRQVLLALLALALTQAPVTAQETTQELPQSPYVWPQTIVYKRRALAGLKQFSRLTNYGLQKWGLIDASGKVVLPANYDQITDIGDQVFLVANNAKASEIPKYWFFDCSSKKLSTNSFLSDEELFYGSEGLIGFRKRDEPDFSGIHKIGFYNFQHEIVIPERYYQASEFRDGLAMVSPEIRGTDKPFRWQFIDKKGNVVAPEIFPVSLFYNGLAIASPYVVSEAQAKVGTHSSSASVSLSPSSQRKYGLINRQFKFVVKPIYRHLQLVVKNVYAAQSNESNHYIAMSPSGEKLFDFPNGISKFTRFDENSNNLIVAEFAATKDELNGVTSPVGAVLDANGKVIVPPKYIVGSIENGEIQLFENTAFQNRASGVMNFKGQWLKPMVYPSRHFNSNVWKKQYRDHNYMDQFAYFLNDYNLIGMDRATLVNLLGAGSDLGDEIGYSLYIGFGCARTGRGFIVDCSDGKVKRWRFAQAFDREPYAWYTENMVFRSGSFETGLVPKARTGAH